MLLTHRPWNALGYWVFAEHANIHTTAVERVRVITLCVTAHKLSEWKGTHFVSVQTAHTDIDTYKYKQWLFHIQTQRIHTHMQQLYHSMEESWAHIAHTMNLKLVRLTQWVIFYHRTDLISIIFTIDTVILFSKFIQQKWQNSQPIAYNENLTDDKLIFH